MVRSKKAKCNKSPKLPSQIQKDKHIFYEAINCNILRFFIPTIDLKFVGSFIRLIEEPYIFDSMNDRAMF